MWTQQVWTKQVWTSLLLCDIGSSLVPRPRSAFCCLQCRKVEEGLPGIFSHMSEVMIERIVEIFTLCVGTQGPEVSKSVR